MVKLLIAIPPFAIALDQRQIAENVVLAALMVTFAAVMVGRTIALGVGSKDVAGRGLERRFKNLEDIGGGDDLSQI